MVHRGLQGRLKEAGCQEVEKEVIKCEGMLPRGHPDLRGGGGCRAEKEVGDS